MTSGLPFPPPLEPDEPDLTSGSNRPKVEPQRTTDERSDMTTTTQDTLLALEAAGINIYDPAIAGFIASVLGRLDQGIVDRKVYIDATRETLERKRNAISEALFAGELQEDQARYSTAIADQQLRALELIAEALEVSA